MLTKASCQPTGVVGQRRTMCLMGLCEGHISVIHSRFGGQVPHEKMNLQRCYWISCLLKNLSPDDIANRWFIYLPTTTDSSPTLLGAGQSDCLQMMQNGKLAG